jgi:hypothetical protein
VRAKEFRNELLQPLTRQASLLQRSYRMKKTPQPGQSTTTGTAHWFSILQLLNSCNSFFLRQPVILQNLLRIRLIDSHRRQRDFLLDLLAVYDL